MNTTGKASARPWRAFEMKEEGRGARIYIESAETDLVAEVLSDLLEEAQADARHIINAVNSHDALAAVCRELVRIPMSIPRHIVKQAEAALALSEGSAAQ